MTHLCNTTIPGVLTPCLHMPVNEIVAAMLLSGIGAAAGYYLITRILHVHP